VISRVIARVSACALALGMTIAVSVTSAATMTDDGYVIHDFNSRVMKYVELRKKGAGSSPGPTDSPEKLAEARRDLASHVKALRPNAAQGDIFTPRISAYFRRRISETLTGKNGTTVRLSLEHAEPVPGLVLHVNEAYPEGIPLQSTPPTLLLALPGLPTGLEYRIVGRTLILRDVAPNLIVDFVPDAIPPSKD
jgi:hypothetical protein